MSRRSPRRRRASRASELATINAAVLAQVIGGLVTPRTQLDPVLLQGIQQLSQAIASVGQSLAGAQQAGSQQMMQMMQQMMQSRGR